MTPARKGLRLDRLLEAPTRTFLQAVAHNETARLMGIGAALGIVGGLAAAAFDGFTTIFGAMLLGVEDPSVAPPVPWRRALAPMLGGLGAGLLIWRFTVNRAPYGIPDVMDGLANRTGRLSSRTGIVSALATTLALGSGHSGGREGPIVQLAASLSSLLCRWLKVPASRLRVLVAAGAAGGVAASFNTPVGGAFFALEVLLGNFALESVAPVVAAAVVGTMVGQALLGDRIALDLPAFGLDHPTGLALYAVLGVICGGLAVVHKEGLMGAMRLRSRIRLPTWLMPALAGLLVGLLALLGFPQIMGNGYGFLEEMLRGDHPGLLFLILLLLVKALATWFTFAGQGGPGIFAPTLFLGAVAGMVFGHGVNGLWPKFTDSPGAYGTVGMGALMAAVMKAPITTTLMLFEMTGNYAVVPPLLITLAISVTVYAAFDSRSIFVAILERRGVKVDWSREELVMYDLKVADIMHQEHLETISTCHGPEELTGRFLRRAVQQVYAVDEDGAYRGLYHIQDLKRAILSPGSEGARRIPEPRVPRAPTADMPLAEVLPLFFRSDLEELPVVDGAGRLVATIRERDVVGAFHREVIRKDALLARIESGEGHRRSTEYLELPEGHVMQSIHVDGQLAGQTLRALRLPGRYNVTVVAVSRLDPHTGRYTREPARAAARLQEGDRLVVMGPRENVAALSTGSVDREETEAVDVEEAGGGSAPGR